MQTVAIKREIFEFTCSGEQKAKNVQQQFRHYVAPQFHNLILKIITEQFLPANLQIEKIVIDLGDIAPEELGEATTLQIFAQSLTQQLLAYKNQVELPHYPTQASRPFSTAVRSNLPAAHPTNSPPENQSEWANSLETLPVAYNESFLATANQPGSSFQQDWELVQTFLTNGDLPWWANKKQTVPLDLYIRRIITQQTDFFKNFLQNQPLGSVIWQRLALVSKPSTRVLINQLSNQSDQNRFLPKINTWQKAGFSFSPVQFSKAQFARLKLFFQRLPVSSASTHKVSLLQKVLAINSLNWVQQAALFDWLSEPDFKKVQAYFTQEKLRVSNSEKRQVQKALQELTWYQLEFLLYPLTIPYLPTSTYIPEDQATFYAQDNSPEFAKNQESPGNPVTNPEPDWRIDQREPAKNQVTSSDPLPPDSTNPANTYPSFRSKPKPAWANFYRQTVFNAMAPGRNNLADRQLKPVYANNPIIATYALVPPVADPKKSYRLNNTAQANTLGSENLKKPAQELAWVPAADAPTFGLLTSITSKRDKPAEARSLKFPDRVSMVEQIPDKPFQSLIRKLAPASPAFRARLQQLSKQDFQNLRRIFNQCVSPEQERRQLLQLLRQHSVYRQARLLQILMQVSAFQPVFLNSPEASDGQPVAAVSAKNRAATKRLLKNISQLHAQGSSVMHRLTVKENAVLQDILKKATGHTPSEQQILRRILLKLPLESLLFLKELSGLPADTLETIRSLQETTPENNREGSSSNGSSTFYVENAGLCLLAPYLPGLFNHLQYLENKEFKNIYTATRALQVVQYLGSGRRQHPEYELVLNKVLCGFHLEKCLAAPVRLTQKETQEADHLLKTVIEHWQALKNTTPAGFRQSFLQRSGVLTEKETHWTLQVERQGHDVLLNTIPWGFTLIKLPWMNKMLQVEW